MRILFINGNSGGSTGSIIRSLRESASKCGFETFLVSYNDSNHSADYISKSNQLYENVNKLLCRIDGSDGFHNKSSTKKMIEFIKQVKPDIIHIHTIHGHFLNIELLLKYIYKAGIDVVWTLHDCWTFTGKCSHFENHDCYKWKSGCYCCHALKEYPSAYIFDATKRLYKKKKSLFEKYGKNITFVVSSRWLFGHFNDSFLAYHDCRVIPNGIQMENHSKKELAFRKNSPITFFSAAYPFTKEKGIEIIDKLAKSLDCEKYRFVVAGLTEREMNKISKNIISIGIIKDERVMDYYYSSSDYFLNPTYQDTFPTVNIESLKNGTPVITFRSGGSPEILTKETGVVIERGSFIALKEFILNKAVHKSCSIEQKCVKRASLFSSDQMCSKYILLYKEKIRSKI